MKRRCAACGRTAPVWIVLHYDRPVALCSSDCWLAWWDMSDHTKDAAATKAAS